MTEYLHGDTSWFVRDRFGMFIHWGLYSMPARHEFVRKREKIDNAGYQVYFDNFNPDLFNPHEWAVTARKAGMKYFVITTKHHEGFCMWDSKFTDYKVTNTPYGRDLLREVVEAFRAEGLRVGFYYSLIDWHHPDFTIDRVHPLYEHPDKDVLNVGRDMARYRQYMRDQVTELLTKYGKIDIIWLDWSYPGEDGKGHDDWDSEGLLQLVRKLQPEIIVNDRLDLPNDAADIVTPEQFLPDTPQLRSDGTLAVWEGCQTFSGSWGYFRDEMSWKSVKMCIELLINHVARGGNMLLNVGPTSRGYFDSRAMNRLEGIAHWMHYNSRAIYNCGRAPKEFIPPANCIYTWNPETRRLYLCCFAWPFKHVHLPNLGDGRVKYAQLLADGSEIHRREGFLNAQAETTPNGALTLDLPVLLPDGCDVPVIELILN